MENIENRRDNNRLYYRSYGTLSSDNNQWPAHIINISSTGALIAIICEHTLTEEAIIHLTVELLEGEDIVMHGKVLHVKDHYIGLHCEPEKQTDKNRLANILKQHDIE